MIDQTILKDEILNITVAGRDTVRLFYLVDTDVTILTDGFADRRNVDVHNILAGNAFGCTQATPCGDIGDRRSDSQTYV